MIEPRPFTAVCRSNSDRPSTPNFSYQRDMPWISVTWYIRDWVTHCKCFNARVWMLAYEFSMLFPSFFSPFSVRSWIRNDCSSGLVTPRVSKVRNSLLTLDPDVRRSAANSVNFVPISRSMSSQASDMDCIVLSKYSNKQVTKPIFLATTASSWHLAERSPVSYSNNDTAFLSDSDIFDLTITESTFRSFDTIALITWDSQWSFCIESDVSTTTQRKIP